MTLEQGPHQLQLTCKGLFTMPNSLSTVPAGSLLLADNVVVDYDGLLSGRRGIKQFGINLATLTGISSTNLFQEFFYDNTKVIWYGDSTVLDTDPNRFFWAYDSDGLGTWVQTTHPFSPPAYTFTDTYRSVQSNGNLYITTTTGLLKTDAPQNALYPAGGFPGLDGVGTVTGSSGFMADNTEVAYRMTWETTDANNNSYEGTPSTRVVVSNSSGHSVNVSLTFTIPNGVTTAIKYNIYRSLVSASSTTAPSDELQLATFGFPTGTDITNRFFTITDTTPESLLGAALYTNSGQQGITQANNIPPLANDVCFFEGYVIYGSATTQQKFLLSLLATDGAGALMLGDHFFVQTTGGPALIFTAASSENATLGNFQLFTGGDPASDILLTKESLIRIINRYAQSSVYAYDSTDLNSATSLPGDFYLQEQGISRVTFGVGSDNHTAWFPVLTSFPAQSPSLAGGFIGQGYCSKFQQPESVPTSNTISVGNQYFEWYRCLPLRNSVIVLKADGCFQLTGSAFPFTVTTLDTGTILTAPDSAVIMSNQVFAYTNQGVVAITETGPGIISRPIENILQQISSFSFPAFPRVTFGTAYETDRKYILSTISESANFTKCTIQYVYDIITQTWTTYEYPLAIWDLKESPTEHRLYAASASSSFPFMFQERKTFTQSDFADVEIPVTISAFTSTTPSTLTVSSTVGASIGWSIAQLILDDAGNPTVLTRIAQITAILDSTHIVVDTLQQWDTTGATFTAYEQPIPIDVQFCPIIGNGETPNSPGNPGVVKFWMEMQAFFQNVQFDFITFNFASDFIASSTPINLVPQATSGGWGLSPWGSGPWGGVSASETQTIRTYIPLPARRAHWLNIEMSLSQAMTQFTFAGLMLTYRPTTTRTK